MTGEHDDLRFMIGPYVLGGLSAADRLELEGHVAGCGSCRSEVGKSAPVPGVLRRLPAPGVWWADDRSPSASAELSGHLLPALLDGVGRERRRRRRRTALRTALVAATIAALAGFGAVAVRQPAPDAPVVELTATGSSSADGEVSLLEMPWGTALTVQMRDLPDAGPFFLEVTSTEGGAAERAATWAATGSRVVEVRGASSFPPEDIASISVVGPAGQVLGFG